MKDLPHHHPSIVIIGRLGTSHGVAGWLKLGSYTHPKEKIFDYPNWSVWHGGRWVTLKREQCKAQGGDLLVKFTECTDREVARTYTNSDIAIPRSELPPVEDGDYYWHDLVGLKVQNTEGVDFGVVEQLLATDNHDLLAVQGERTRYIPFRKAIIKSVDLQKGLIIVDWDSTF